MKKETQKFIDEMIMKGYLAYLPYIKNRQTLDIEVIDKLEEEIIPDSMISRYSYQEYCRVFEIIKDLLDSVNISVPICGEENAFIVWNAPMKFFSYNTYAKPYPFHIALLSELNSTASLVFEIQDLTKHNPSCTGPFLKLLMKIVKYYKVNALQPVIDFPYYTMDQTGQVFSVDDFKLNCVDSTKPYFKQHIPSYCSGFTRHVFNFESIDDIKYVLMHNEPYYLRKHDNTGTEPYETIMFESGHVAGFVYNVTHEELGKTIPYFQKKGSDK